MIQIDLSGKQIVMTGAFGAIAEFVVKRLAEAGATMVLTDRDPPPERAGEGDVYRMDVTDAAEVSRVVSGVFEKYPRLDIALGHAGGTGICPFLETTSGQFEEIVRFNFLGQVWFARAVVAQWVQRGTKGHLIFTSSWASRIPMAGIAAYSASKVALEMFMRSLALEVAPHGIRVNAVCPGNVAIGSSHLCYESDPAYRAWVDRVSPLGRRNSPAAIADAFLFLCSDLSAEMDGQILQVDMGVGLPKLG